MAAAEACVWVSWLVELTELPFSPLKNGGPKEPDLKSQLIVDFVLHSQLHSGLDDIFTLWFWSKRKEEQEISRRERERVWVLQNSVWAREKPFLFFKGNVDTYHFSKAWSNQMLKCLTASHLETLNLEIWNA